MIGSLPINGGYWFRILPLEKWKPVIRRESQKHQLRGGNGDHLGKFGGRCEWENILYHTVSCSGCPPIFEDIHRQLRPFLTGAQSFPGPSPASHINCEHDAIVLILGFN